MTAAKDPLWEKIRKEVTKDAREEQMLASFFFAVVLNHKKLEAALGFLLATKLESSTLTAVTLRDLFEEAFTGDRKIGKCVRADIEAVVTRDPACRKYSVPLLYLKGYHALQSYRLAHYFWQQGRQSLATYLQSRMSEVFQADIHPAAKIGKGILMDHATGVVIGETSVVGDNVSILQQVTLGGTGKDVGDRHPKVGKGVLIGAGAKILGNVKLGEGAKIGAGAVVLKDVPAHTSVAGVPASVVGKARFPQPALEMDHRLPSTDECL